MVDSGSQAASVPVKREASLDSAILRNFSYNAPECPRIFYVFSDPKFHLRTEVRFYPRNVPSFFLNRSFDGVEPPEGRENVPEIMTGIFLQLVSAPLNRMHRKTEKC